MQALFESFAVPNAFVIAPQILELYASGKEDGVLLGVGHTSTYAVLLHEGLPDPRTMVRSSIAGKELDMHVQKLLHGTAELTEESARHVKEALGHVAPAPGQETGIVAQDFKLPDG